MLIFATLTCRSRWQHRNGLSRIVGKVGIFLFLNNRVELLDSPFQFLSLYDEIPTVVGKSIFEIAPYATLPFFNYITHVIRIVHVFTFTQCRRLYESKRLWMVPRIDSSNYVVVVLNTSSIETVKTREGHFYRFASFFRLFICRFKINAYLCGGSGQSFVPGRNSRTGIFPVFLFIHKAFVSIFDNYYSVS